jgi:hypothetical protein
VFGLITAIDAICFVLFHVERKERWLYRWRMVGDWPSVYLQWQEGVSTIPFVRVQPPAQGCVVEVEARLSEEDGWRPAELVEIAPRLGCRFRLTAKCDLSLPDEVHSLMGAVRDHGVGCYRFRGAVRLKAGESVEVEALADSPMLSNVLLEPGDMACWDERLEVVNVGPSVDWWVPSSRAEPRLCRDPRRRMQKIFAFGDPGLSKPEPV